MFQTLYLAVFGRGAEPRLAHGGNLHDSHQKPALHPTRSGGLAPQPPLQRGIHFSSGHFVHA
eukprot:3548446-Pyramimonas_sp.AAC.1